MELKPALILKPDPPSKAHGPGRPKSMERNWFLCYSFKRSQHPKDEIIFDPCGWEKSWTLVSGLKGPRPLPCPQFLHWGLELKQTHFGALPCREKIQEKDPSEILMIQWDVFKPNQLTPKKTKNNAKIQLERNNIKQHSLNTRCMFCSADRQNIHYPKSSSIPRG